MKKVAIAVVLVAALVAVFFALRGGGVTPAAAGAVPAASTASLSGLQQLDAVARRWLPVVGLVEPSLTPEAVRNQAGFDPTTAAGWREIGVDPEAGFAFAVDARLVIEAEPVPMLLLKLTDTERALAWLSARAGEPARIEGDGPVRTFKIGERGTPVGERSGWTVVPLVQPGDAPLLEKAFAEVIADGGDPLDGSAAFSDGFAGAEPPRVYWWGGAAAAGSLAAAVGLPEELTSTVDFFAAMYPAAAFWLAEGSSGTRLVATEKGQSLLRKLFVPQRRPPKVARYIGRSGWGAVRLSANLDTVLDGVGEAMPPAAAKARAVVGAARMALPMAAGVNWDDISAGLSGHVVLAGDITTLDGLFEGRGDGLALVGVADPVRADALVEKVVARLSKQMPGIEVAEVDFEGRAGRAISLGGLELSVVRDDEVIVLGPRSSVTAAFKRAGGEHLDGRLADALDGGALWAAVIDPAPALAQRPTGQQGGAPDPLQLPALKPFADDPRISLTVTLDREGLLWRTESAVPLDMLTLVAASLGRAEAAAPAAPPTAPE